MAKRKIIKIDENLCNGCGQCIHACSEGALKLVNGKAKLVREDFCDGFGDCLGECPTGALTIEEKDAPEFDFRATLDHVTSSLGSEGVDRFLHAAREHGLIDHPHHAAISHPPTKPADSPAPRQGGCPGSRHVSRTHPSSTTPVADTGLPGKIIESDLAQWPVQLHLVNPGADFFSNRELVVLSTCAPVASADVHWRFLRGRSAVVACPKLDRTEPYEEKLAAILSNPTIPKVIVVRMSVPCCGGLTHLVTRAMERIERNDLEFQEIIVDIDGHIRG
jgi:NAD-dependent dihydropyrimidine dehydrogenase PreA subunit